MATKEEQIEKILKDIDFKNLTAEQITGEDWLLKILTKRIVEKAINAEMDHHFWCVKYDSTRKKRQLSQQYKQEDR